MRSNRLNEGRVSKMTQSREVFLIWTDRCCAFLAFIEALLRAVVVCNYPRCPLSDQRDETSRSTEAAENNCGEEHELLQGHDAAQGAQYSDVLSMNCQRDRIFRWPKQSASSSRLKLSKTSGLQVGPNVESHAFAPANQHSETIRAVVLGRRGPWKIDIPQTPFLLQAKRIAIRSSPSERLLDNRATLERIAVCT